MPRSSSRNNLNGYSISLKIPDYLFTKYVWFLISGKKPLRVIYVIKFIYVIRNLKFFHSFYWLNFFSYVCIASGTLIAYQPTYSKHGGLECGISPKINE